MRLPFCAAMLLALGSMVTQAQAGVIVHFDLDSATAGIQDTRFVTDANPFDVNVVLEITDTTQISTYGGLRARLDSGEGAFTDFSFTPYTGWFTELSTAISSGTGDAVVGDYSQVGPLGAGGLPALPGTAILSSGFFTVATLEVTPGTVSGLTDTDLYFFDGGDLVFRDETSTDIALSEVQFRTGTLATAVPEPSTFIALGVCCGSGLVVRYRRRRAAKA